MKPSSTIDKTRALKEVIEFCRQQGLAENKLNELHTQEIMGKLYFLHSNGVKPLGLINDRDTVPHPVLLVSSDYAVSATEYTEKYLSPN